MIGLTQCALCRHFRPGTLRPTCTAFPAPGSIPQEILLGLHDHHREFPGDRGVRYEPRSDAPVELAREPYYA